jgi:hypothetical protein
MLEITQFVKSGFLHFGNTKTEVEFLNYGAKNTIILQIRLEGFCIQK